MKAQSGSWNIFSISCFSRDECFLKKLVKSLKIRKYIIKHIRKNRAPEKQAITHH